MQAMLNRAKQDTSVGTENLATRERTRLWYRAPHHAPVDDQFIAEQTAEVPARPVVAPAECVRREPTGPLRTMQALQSTLDQADTEVPPVAPEFDGETLTGWRDAPKYCPILLLSANPILDARVPGPILGPGTQYRIVSLADGVACVQVDALNGQIGLGYCNAVDLICYEPDIMYLRGEKRSGRRYTARLNLNRISQRIAGATGSLLG